MRENVLNPEQIKTFLSNGVLVVDNILTEDEIQKGLEGFSKTLATAGVDTDDLTHTGHGLTKLSSTNGSGGVLDIFYDAWKLEIATHPKLFYATSQLWEAAYCSNGEEKEELAECDYHKWHPYGPFDCRKGYCYIDRIGFRLPTKLATSLGSDVRCINQNTTNNSSGKKKKKNKAVAIQRSLTPHLDCCPETIFSGDKTKWRPIQCFISLSDTLEPNMGGFEAVQGFHIDFNKWAARRPPTRQTRRKKQQLNGKLVVTQEEVSFPAPCIGEYTHIRPVEDRDVMQQVQHIPAKKGSAVFFDNRIPHANAYRHDGDLPRSVVYCSFLPDTPINRKYAENQLMKWKRGEPPNDQWIGNGSRSGDKNFYAQPNCSSLTPLAKKLLFLEQW